MSEERIQPEPGFWEWLAAMACFVLGVLALAVGFVLTTDKLLDGHLHPSLHTLGIVLLIIGLPVIILGGHFMDLGEKKNGHVVLVLFAVLLLSSSAAHAQQERSEALQRSDASVTSIGSVSSCAPASPAVDWAAPVCHTGTWSMR